MNIKELIVSYRDIRDELDTRRKQYNAFERDAKEKLLELETQMLVISDETGVDSFKTADGTAFRTTKTYARLSEGPDARDLRIKYAMDTGDFSLFTSHVNKTHARELLDDGINLEECGISWVEEYAISFRKASK